MSPRVWTLPGGADASSLGGCGCGDASCSAGGAAAASAVPVGASSASVVASSTPGVPSRPDELVLFNSLVDAKVPFVPSGGRGSRRVSWYACGPTVYDSAHLGHARNYVSGDFVRRVLEDYFGYEILFVMNVTDVDDKIIKRARRGHLAALYLAEAHAPAEVRAAALAALRSDAAETCAESERAKAALEEARAGAAACADAGTGEAAGAAPRRSSALDAAEQEAAAAELLAARAAEALAKAEQAAEQEDANKSGDTGDKSSSTAASLSSEAWFALGGDALLSVLDASRGATVTDPAIYRRHAARYEAEFLDDMEALGVRPPTVLTRVSEYMPEIVAFTQRLVDLGMAYPGASGSVYFDVDAFERNGHVYGKLAPWAAKAAARAAAGAEKKKENEGENEGETEGKTEVSASESAPASSSSSSAAAAASKSAPAAAAAAAASSAAASSVPVVSEKRSARDFALWKSSRPGEPSWPSPWGPGRPGWHVECSAMATSVVNGPLDIHSGGEDLRFPHHTNELAQSEAFYHASCSPACHQWVNYFVHAGHLGIEGLKMSKSLKNFVTIREELRHTPARRLRMLFALAPWDRRMAFGRRALDEAASREAQLRNLYANVDVALRAAPVAKARQRWGERERALHAALGGARDAVHAAFCNSIDTRKALDALADLTKAVNAYLDAKKKESNAAAAQVEAADADPGLPAAGLPCAFLLRETIAFVSRILRVLGLSVGGAEATEERDAAAACGALPQGDPADGASGATNASLAAGGAFATSASASSSSSSAPPPPALIDAVSAFRDSVRSAARAAAANNTSPLPAVMAACDALRDEVLPDFGVRLEDVPNEPSVWKRDDPEAIRESIRERRRAAAGAARAKLAVRVATATAKLDKLRALAALPTPEQIYEFDPETGLPAKIIESGKVLEGKERDKARKDVEKKRKALAPLLKDREQGIDTIAKATADLQELQDKLDALEI